MGCCALVNLIEPLLPSLVSFISGCGLRTLYSYVLHLWLIIFAVYMDVPNLGLPFALQGHGYWLIAVQINIVLSSRGTEKLFKYVVMPYWILDVPEWVVAKLK